LKNAVPVKFKKKKWQKSGRVAGFLNKNKLIAFKNEIFFYKTFFLIFKSSFLKVAVFFLPLIY